MVNRTPYLFISGTGRLKAPALHLLSDRPTNDTLEGA